MNHLPLSTAGETDTMDYVRRFDGGDEAREVDDVIVRRAYLSQVFSIEIEI